MLRSVWKSCLGSDYPPNAIMRRLDSLLRPGRVVAICEQNWNTEEYTVVLENVSGDGVEDRLDRREIRCTGMYEQESPQEMTWA